MTGMRLSLVVVTAAASIHCCGQRVVSPAEQSRNAVSADGAGDGDAGSRPRSRELIGVLQSGSATRAEKVSALRALGADRSTNAIPAIIAVLDLDDPVVHDYPAVKALSEIGGAAVGALQEFILGADPHSDWSKIACASIALKSIIGEAAVDEWAKANREHLTTMTFQIVTAKEL